MKIEIPDCYIKTWQDNLELNGYDAPANEEEWIELIKLCVDKEVGEDQFDWKITRKQRSTSRHNASSSDRSDNTLTRINQYGDGIKKNNYPQNGGDI